MLGGLDYRSIATAVKAALARVGVTLGSLTVTGSASIAGTLSVPQISFTTQALADAANVAWDLSLGAVATWTIGGARTLTNPANIKKGCLYQLQITQDGTGGRLVTWGSAYMGLGRSTQPQQPSQAAGAVTVYYFTSTDGATLQLVSPTGPAYGQCQLAKSGANVVLSPFNGNLLTINGRAEVVPDAGVSLAPPAVASTTYYIYAYMNAGVMTLENSATVPATQAGSAIKIKTGDATRTLIGMARTTAGNAWADTVTQRYTRSYFNRQRSALNGSALGAPNTTSATVIEADSSKRVEFVMWADDGISLGLSGAANEDAAGAIGSVGIGVDSTSAYTGAGYFQQHANASYQYPVAVPSFPNGLADGYHYATVLFQSNGANSITINNGTMSIRGVIW